jgi:catechol 2,3-dioxygenase-like lactoylglutathione lyase family enzyme
MGDRNIVQVTPFMHVADLEAAVRFFEDTLGFATSFRVDGYAYVEREGAGVRIQSHSDALELGIPHRGFAYYFDVRDIDALTAELAPKLAGLTAGSVHGPVDQGYGQRELMIRAPDGNLIVFGQVIGN